MVVFLLILIVCCLMFGGEQTAEVGAVLLLVLGLFGMLFG